VPKRKWASGAVFFFRCRSPRRRPPVGRATDDSTPIHVLFVEDSEVDVELARARSIRAGSRSRGPVDAEDYLKRALASSNRTRSVPIFSMRASTGATRCACERPRSGFLSLPVGPHRDDGRSRRSVGATDYVLKNNMRRLGTLVKTGPVGCERTQAHPAIAMRIARAWWSDPRATQRHVCMTDPAWMITYLKRRGQIDRRAGAGGAAILGLDLSGLGSGADRALSANRFASREGV